MIDMMALLPEHHHERFDSRHRLVIAASQRAKHLLQGAKPTGYSRFTKPTTIGLDEVLHGAISFLTGEDARQALRDAKRGKESEVEKMAMAEITEDAREIKKELGVYLDDAKAGGGNEPAGEE